MTADISVTFHTGRPNFWKVERRIGEHVTEWTYLDETSARREAERMATWSDDFRPEGWPLAHLYERD